MLCIFACMSVKHSKWNSTSNVAWSPIQSKRQGIKNSRGWRLEATERWVGQNFKKVGSQYKGRGGGLHNIGCVRDPLPTMTHNEVFWKKDALIVWENLWKDLWRSSFLVKLQPRISSVTVIFEEFSLKLPEHVFHRIHLSGCFLKLYS